MKKLIFTLVCLFSIQSVVLADNDKPISVNQLPKTAQVIIKNYFSGQKISLAKVESEWLTKSYDVIFTNGDKIEFDKNGHWKQIDCKYSQVPKAIIPLGISKYVSANYPNDKIVKIDKDSNDYEVKLSSGWEIKFNKKFQVINVDR